MNETELLTHIYHTLLVIQITLSAILGAVLAK